MKKYFSIQFITLMSMMLFCAAASAQEITLDEIDNAEGASIPTPEADTTASPAAENTLEACKDTADNDNDGFVDCVDQDCGIFALCSSTSAAVAIDTSSGVTVKESATVKIFERGRMCKDGIDNDEDGFADCHDVKCQSSNYCQREMYEYPSEPYKPMGPFFQVGIGLALPNFNWKETRVDSQYGQNVPFDPDLGGMMNFKVGVAPIPWLGFGMNMGGGGTFGTNRAEFFSLADLENEYKYDGYKVFGHLGAFVRFQYPARRFNAYLDVAGGYSFARYKWRVYDGDASWSDISGDWEDENWEENTDVPYETKYKQGHHFSLILEPGFDYFFVERKLGAGLRAWIPVFSSENKGMDNIGILFNITFTPTWREPRRLKDEYK